MSSESESLRSKLINDYYSKVYPDYFYGSGMSKISGINHKLLEKSRITIPIENILEIGAGQGEHLKYLRVEPRLNYYCIDKKLPRTSDYHRKSTFKVKFLEMNVEELKFDDCSFQRVLSTCVLHHIDDVLAALLEIRRVMSIGGECRIVLPTDPGLLNQFVKRVFLFPRFKRYSDVSPQLIYALEHKNHIGGIMDLIKYVFRDDDLKFRFFPFGIKSWNLNLLVLASAVKVRK
jgi:phosphatidylethanolamine/phosphatidyl-N-methylethanolamine N-methyltransferase